MSLAKKSDSIISEEEYLQGELISEIKHEYMDGCVYAMAGARKNHERIAGNIFRGLGNKLQENNSPCDIFSSDMKVKANTNTNFFYPDVSIDCDPDDNESEYYINSPIIIVEVLSKSTRKNDKGQKKIAYFNIPSLQEYVIIDQDYCEIEVFRKANDWKSSFYFIGDEITLESIDTTLSVEAIYYRVENEDMAHFLKEKEEKKTMENEKSNG